MDMNKAEKVGLSSERMHRLTAKMRELAETQALPGLAIAISRRGKLAYIESFGVSDIESLREIQNDTIFRIYSITKLVTCTALMSLVEEGQVQLCDPLVKYMPHFGQTNVYKGAAASEITFEKPGRDILIRDLLTHTSGMAYVFNADEPAVKDLYQRAELLRPDRSLEEMVNKLAELPLLFHPGQKYLYSHSVDVAGRLIEIASGKAIDVFFDERVFNPLRMVDTGFYVPQKHLGRFATLYVANASGSLVPVDKPAESIHAGLPRLLIPGSGLVSTVMDCLRFGQMLLNNGTLDGQRILSRKSVELMTSNHLSDELLPGNGIGQGFGLQVCLDPLRSALMASKGAFGKGGAGGSIIWVDPEEELCFVVMSQLISAELVRSFPYLFSEALPPGNDSLAAPIDLGSLIHVLVYQALE